MSDWPPPLPDPVLFGYPDNWNWQYTNSQLNEISYSKQPGIQFNQDFQVAKSSYYVQPNLVAFSL